MSSTEGIFLASVGRSMVRFPEKFPECEQILAPDGTYDDKAVEDLVSLTKLSGRCTSP